MKLKEMYEILTREGIEKYFDEEIIILLTRPSLGPRASCEVSRVQHGFDWENNKFIIYPQIPLVKKPESMSIFDAANDLIFYLTKEGLKRKKKQWYHTKAIDIFEKIHGTDFQEKFKNIFKD